MKKIFTIVFLILIFQKSQSQITLEHSYPNSAQKMFGVNLSNSGFKYCMVDMINMTDNQVILYNLDHSIFKTMPFAATTGTRTIWYISENTFDLDSGVEFMVASNSATRIYNEDGTLLFERVGEIPAWYNERSPQDQINSIFSTPTGTKMILSSNVDGASKVYSLPGSLPLALNEFTNPNQDYDIRLFPNPTKNNKISIAYTLPENVKIGKVNIYNSVGQIVKTFNVDNNFSTIELNTENLASGTYICEVLGNAKRISTSQFIVEN
jgi:hypothetical protein